MRLLVIILLFALLFISQINTIVDVDLWWNLKTGEHIIKNLEIPRVDIFSYTLKDRPWIDHEWLSHVLFYLVFSGCGWLGLNILKALVISSCFLILLYLTCSKNKKIIFAIFFTLLAILAFGYRSFFRPEIFSYLILCIFLYVLEKEERLYILPFLQIVWVNLHGYFILGPFLIFLYSMGEFLSGDRGKSKKFAIVFLWAALACLINPYFYKGALYPLSILLDVFTEQKLCMQNVHELMMPIKFSFGKYIFFWFFAILTSITFLINLKKVRATHILLFAFSFLASYMAMRNASVFIFLAMPIAIMNLNEAFSTTPPLDRKHNVVYIVIICFFIYFFASNKYYSFTDQPSFRKTESRFARPLMPSGACDFLQENSIEGVMFNTPDFGPYIAYRFYPERRIFIDTRTDLYKDDFYNLYMRAQNYPNEWRVLHKEYGFNIVLLRHFFSGTERILRFLHEDSNWKLVYYDINSCVFLEDIPKNKKFIERFRIDFRERALADSDVDLNTAIFFEKIGEGDFAEKAYVKLLKNNPRLLQAGNNLATIYTNTGRHEEAIRLLEELLQVHPGSAELHANLGTAYLSLGRRQDARLYLEKSLRLNPYLRNACYTLGIIYLEAGEVDRAIGLFVKYLKLDSYNAGVHRILGDIYTQKGLSQKAVSEYNEANALDGKEI